MICWQKCRADTADMSAGSAFWTKKGHGDILHMQLRPSFDNGMGSECLFCGRQQLKCGG